MPIISFKSITPTLDATTWVAPTASVIGDTHIGAHSSIWFGAVLRGDVEPIRIGAYTNVQDNAVIHVTSKKFATHIGNHVTIGHAAIVHACTVEDGALIGMGSIVLDGAVVGAGAFVAAGAVVSPGKRVTSGWLWAGVPARPVRQLTAEEKAYLPWSAQHYADLSKNYR
ncbi:MAG: gamma carbonic anhydrase family protein [Proteobacteria bacterium]|nr:gamma carbonic anhydrase family protein [Pseudomonadota bacterium]